MTSFVAYLWCIYSILFININSQSITNNVCFWGCRDPEVCMVMNGVFYAVPVWVQTINNKQYYKMSDLNLPNCDSATYGQTYFLYWRSDPSNTGWYIGFSDDPNSYNFESTNINGRCSAANLGNPAYPSSCTDWEFVHPQTGWTSYSTVSITEGECPQAACDYLNVIVDPNNAAGLRSNTRRFGACETNDFDPGDGSAYFVKQGPYPNMFWSARLGSGNASLVFNYKSWRWGCYANPNGAPEVAARAPEPRCGGEYGGITAYSSDYADFDGLAEDDSITVAMDVFDGSGFTTYTDVAVQITCVGDGSIIDLTPGPTPADFGDTPVKAYTYPPTLTAYPTVPGQTIAPGNPTPATTNFPTPPTIDCSKWPCVCYGDDHPDCIAAGGSGSGNDSDSCAGMSGLCWWWWLLIFLLILCCICICCILLCKWKKKRDENTSKDTEMFGKQEPDDTTGSNPNPAATGSYQPDNNYGGNYDNTQQNQYNQQPQQNQYNQQPQQNQGWGNNQNQYNQNPNQNQWGNNSQYGGQPQQNQWNQNQYGQQNQYGGQQNQWGNNQTYTQD